MRIPRYWAKGATSTGMQTRDPAMGRVMGPFSCWGWSDVSVEEAEERGRQRADAIAKMLRQGDRPDRYLYGDGPMREEVLEEWKRDDDTTYAAVTLNVYGCQVLNTASVMFVDVDLPPVSPLYTFICKVRRLFGDSDPSPRERLETEAITRVQGMIDADARCGVRVYRTRGGLRYLLTHDHAEPAADTTLTTMALLGADPLYVRLCKVQECFRARLNPKPWRCGFRSLNTRYPWQDEQTERAVRDWVDAYSQQAERYATCSLIDHLGSRTMDDEVARVVEFHDAATKANSSLKLA